MSIVSNNLKYLRRLNGLTQEQFSRRIGIKRSLLGAYEEARANPNLDNLMMIAKVFGVSVDQLLKHDLRRVRETPDLTSQNSSSSPLLTNKTENTEQTIWQHASHSSPRIESEDPKPLASIVDKYFRESPKINWVAQKIAFKKISLKDGIKSVLHTKVEAFHKNPTEFQSTNQVYQKQATDHKESITVSLVKRSQANEYVMKCQNPEYVRMLSTFSVPRLQDGNFRAFEIGTDFTFEGSLLIGQFVKNWYEIQDGTCHVVVLRNEGVIYRRIYNQLKTKGVLIISSDIQNIPTKEVPQKEVVEIWEVKAFLSYQLPELTVPLPRIKHLVEELRQELDSVKS